MWKNNWQKERVMEEFIKLFKPGELTAEQETRLWEFAREFDLTIADVTEYQETHKNTTIQ